MLRFVCSVVMAVVLMSAPCSALTTADFLRIPVGGKALAMGEVFTAIADDASAMYWNPAGMAGIKSMQAFAMYNNYLLASMHGVGSFVMPMKNDLALGAMFTYYAQESFDLLDDNGTVIGTVAPSDMAVSVGGSKLFSQQLSVGAAGKFISSTLYQKTATAFAADIGAIYNLNPDISFGASVRNLGTSMTFVSEAQGLPMTIAAGAVYKRKMSSTNNLTAGGEFAMCDGKTKISFGGEYSLNNIFLRAGYLLNDTQKSYTLGAGLALQKLRIDVAYIPYKLLGDTFSVSLSYALGN
ncbi:MAG: PorV/PorQ family protein [Elusimicrobiota bacterium]